MIYSHIYKNKIMMFSPNSVELPGEKEAGPKQEVASSDQETPHGKGLGPVYLNAQGSASVKLVEKASRRPLAGFRGGCRGAAVLASLRLQPQKPNTDTSGRRPGSPRRLPHRLLLVP